MGWWQIEAITILSPAIVWLGYRYYKYRKQGIYDDKKEYKKAMKSGDLPDVAKKK